MRQLALLLFLLCGCRSVRAAPASVWWFGWRVSSSEELSQGMKYSRDEEAPAYPLSLMFDNDPATAWVFSSVVKEWDKEVWRSPHGLMLEPDRPVVVDGLRLMNGQNQSRARFLRNDRVTKLRVTMDTGRAEIVRTFNLPDRMGWHSVALPRRAVKSLKIEFTGIRRGQGPQRDLCIAELALLRGGRLVDMAMPRAVMFYNGLEGCGASLLLTRRGEVLDGIATDAGYSDEWSANGRYVCGFNGGNESVWIADTWRAKIVRRLSHPRRPEFRWLSYEWLGANTLEVTGRSFRKTTKLPS